MKERTGSGFRLVTFGSVKIASQGGHGPNRLAWVFAAFAVACIWASRPCDGQIQVEAYIPSFNSATVSVIDTKTNTRLGSMLVGNGPNGVAVTPDGRFAYITNFFSNTVSVIDPTTNTVVGFPIPVGTNPFGVAVTPDGRFAYVTNLVSASVSVINTATNTVVGAAIPVWTYSFCFWFFHYAEHHCGSRRSTISSQ
jgi:YVTN family beta-propeller protein